MAEVITSIFEVEDSSNNDNNRRREFMARMMRGGRGGPPGPPDMDSSSSSDSEARKAASRVVAVADERTNSLVVSAPEELIPTIEKVVEEIDRAAEDPTEVRVFRLRHADAYEMAEMITELYSDDQTSQDDQRPRFGPGSRGGGQQQSSSDSRTVLDYTVTAIADYRTKSVVVSAAPAQMAQIAQMIEELDSDPSKKQKVFVYRLQNADVENVAEILRGMFEDENTSTNRSTSSSFQNNLNNSSSTTSGTTGAFGSTQTSR